MRKQNCIEVPAAAHAQEQQGCIHTNTQGGPLTFLRASNEAYEWLVRRVQVEERRGGPERVLRSVEQAALCAMLSHPGRFADGAIENVALAIGSEMKSLAHEESLVGFTYSKPGTRTKRRVLHVATRVMEVGGHTRMMCRWILEDQESCHSVLLIDQEDRPIPAWLSDAVQKSDGTLIALPAPLSLCRKAQQLRDLARRHADLVVLHHHCFDVVPTVAFAVKDGPPIAVLNHADHLFWLGSTVADAVINLRTPSSTLSAERRSSSHNTVLPVPLVDQLDKTSRRSARESLQIPQDEIMLLSVGRDEKYRPCGAYDFVATAARILNDSPGVHLYVIGLTLADLSPFLRCQVHERLHFMGVIDDPSLYRASADIYLESFPFGSQTALLEAALCGLPVVPAYAPLFPLLVACDDCVQDLIPNPRSEQEYIERVTTLIRQPERRVDLGSSLRKRLLATHVGEGWGRQLRALYQQTDRLVHDPRPIPAFACEAADADIGLSMWHAMSGGSNAAVSADQAMSGALLNTASIARHIGNYAMARHIAWRAFCRTPGSLKCWRLLLLAYLGRSARFIKKVAWWRAKGSRA